MAKKIKIGYFSVVPATFWEPGTNIEVGKIRLTLFVYD